MVGGSKIRCIELRNGNAGSLASFRDDKNSRQSVAVVAVHRRSIEIDPCSEEHKRAQSQEEYEEPAVLISLDANGPPNGGAGQEYGRIPLFEQHAVENFVLMGYDV